MLGLGLGFGLPLGLAEQVSFKAHLPGLGMG